MSTKIYNGYKIPAYSITELMKFLHGFRDYANELIDTHQMKRVVMQATLKYDQDVLEGSEIQTDYLASAWVDIHQEILEDAKESSRRSPANDYGLDMVIFPRKKYHLVLVFSEKNEKLFAEYPEVEEYSYWDNTDRPDNLTAKEWKARGKDWALDWHGPANQAGLSFTVRKQDGFFMPDLGKTESWEPLIPNLEDRITRLEYEKRGELGNAWGEVFFAENKEDPNKEGTYKIFAQLREYYESEEYLTAIEAYKENAAKVLTSVTAETLFNIPEEEDEEIL